MGKGRKPIPTAIKILAGNPGKRPLNGQEPDFKKSAECPGWLDEYGREEWFLVAAELSRLGMLTQVDRSALAAYCAACSLLRKAQKEIDRHGITTTEIQFDKEGNEIGSIIRKNPAVNIIKDAMATIKSFVSEFGFTPSSRTKVKAPKVEGDDLDDFLNGNRNGSLSESA